MDVQGGPKVHTFKNLHGYYSYVYVLSNVPRTICMNFSFHMTWLQKVMTFSRRMARKLSCMTTKDVQVPPQGPQERRQTRRRQRAAIDILEGSHARCRDDEDNDRGDDASDDLPHEQDEMTGSQLADAPQATQTQVSAITNYYMIW